MKGQREGREVGRCGCQNDGLGEEKGGREEDGEGGREGEREGEREGAFTWRARRMRMRREKAV